MFPWILFIAAAIFAFAASPGYSAVIISEVLAENDGGLNDFNSSSPDWIELRNTSAAPVNLAGWRLTDNEANLSKWTFPSITIVPGGYLIVFASGTSVTNHPTELHANFQLAQEGGFIALVRPDNTVTDSLTYGPQRANISFGMGRSETAATILASSSAARWHVPANDALGLSWTAPGFNDSLWNAASMPLQYEVLVGGGAALKIDVNARAADTAGNTETGFTGFTMTQGSGIQTTASTRNYGSISVTVSNSSAAVGYEDRLRASPANGGGFTAQNLLRDFIFSREAAGLSGLDVHVTGLAAGQPHDVTVWSFDASSIGTRVSDWFINGVLLTNNYTFNGGILPTSDLQYRFTIRGNANAAGTLIISGRRDSSSVDQNNAASFGVFLNAFQIDPVTTVTTTNGNVAAMAGQNASLYSRIPFSVANPAAFEDLKLRVRYDDGFIAYVNGTEVVRRNAPVTAGYNSSAAHTNSAMEWEEIVLPGAAALLSSGANVLAVHGLNADAADLDFYFEAEIIAVQAVILGPRYFSPPTPGTDNDTGYLGLVADTKFSVDRGFFDTPFSLSIICATAGAEIRFTTNGSVPTPSNGSLYTAAIPITRQSFIRAAAFLPGYVPSDVDTHSYIFLRDVLQQSNNIPGYPLTWQNEYPADYAVDPAIVNHPVYGLTLSNDLRSIATLCIVSEQNGLWHSSTGIYPNATSSGPAWEREGSMELIGGDGATEFATTAEVEMHGNASRDNGRTPKHSIRLSFNSKYGPPKLRYNWFGGGVDAHDRIILRSCGFVDGWAGRYADNGVYTSTETGESFRGQRYRPENTCYVRDVWVKDSFREMGWLSSRSAFVHLYLNGLYWGLYEPSEALNASYFVEHVGGNEGAWDVVVGEDNNGPPVVVDGTVDDWQNLLNIANAGITNELAYQAVAALVDIDNLIDYMLLHIVAESEDWPRHNWYVAHRRATNGMPATKFICSVWDQELTLDRLVRRNRVNVGTSGGEVYSPARIYHQLRSWPEFRRQFGDRVHKHLFNNGALTPSNNVARLLASASAIRDAVVGESARWGDARKFPTPGNTVGTGQTFTRDEWWQPEIDKLATNFFQKLTGDNVTRLRAASLYPSLNAPTFNVFGGAVTNGFMVSISHSNAAGSIYFTTDGTDPRQYGTAAISGTAEAWSSSFPLLTTTKIRARVYNGGLWSALTEAVFYPPQELSALRLTEIMYNPPAVGNVSGDEFEFVELKNAGTNALNLSGIHFSEGIEFAFTNGSTLAAGAFAVLARNAAVFATKYPGVPVYGLFTGRLDNGGEPLAVAAGSGTGIFSVEYDDVAPWPLAPDNHGFTLVPRNSVDTQAPDDGARWRASTARGGSPGADDPEPTIPPVLINEILTHTDLPAVDRIEIFNPTSTNVHIGGWFLTDDPGAPKKYRLPLGQELQAGGYYVFDESHFNPVPPVNTSFSLSSQGERVYLVSADAQGNLTGYSHGFSFGAAANGVTFGRYVTSIGEEHFPAQITATFGAPNTGPLVGPVVINEIHYNPPSPQSPLLGFVELKNITPASVSLFDPAYPSNTWRISGLNFTFPTNTVIPPHGLILITATNSDIFRAHYGLPPDMSIAGQFNGSLQRSGERLSLERPDAPATNGVPYIVVDSLRYNDKAPWPPAADGSGASLQRLASGAYGDDPINWFAAAPTPGSDNASLDSDADGLPNDWEATHGTNPNMADAFEDPDNDGFTNAQEYAAGTHPNDAASRLQFSLASLSGGIVQLEFNASANRSYTVSAKDVLDTPAWTVITNVAQASATRIITIREPATNQTRFYRISVP